MPVETIKTAEEYNSFVNANAKSVVLFSADWADQCKQVQDVLEDLSKILGQLQFASVIAENFPEISMKHQIDAVPTVILFTKGVVIDRVDGVDVASLTEKCKKLGASTATVESLEDRLKALINKAPVMVFMKGDPNDPQCGFSKQVVAFLSSVRVPFETFNILADEEVRQGLKTYSDWPTYPQVYVKGELIGGVDIIRELMHRDELEKTLMG